MNFAWAGDSHLVVEFARHIDLDINRQVHGLAQKLEAQPLPGFIECIPSYSSLLISFNPLQLSGEDLMEHCQYLLKSSHLAESSSAFAFEIPTLYGGTHGPDLEDVAEEVGLNPKLVISLHSSVSYRIYMMGFMPGYPYLGGLDERIAVPRLKTPRTRVPGGSVAIAEQQTGIYPVTSPGGWRIIGHTPLRLYHPEANPPALLRAGNYVKFRSIGLEEYTRIEAQVAAGIYQLVTYPYEQEAPR